MSKIIRAITAVFVFLSVVLSCVNVWADTALSSVCVTGKSLTVNGDCEHSDNVIKNNGIDGLTILVAKEPLIN